MAGYAQDDLISFASAENSPPTQSSGPPGIPSMALTMENTERPKPTPTQPCFAELANIMRSHSFSSQATASLKRATNDSTHYTNGVVPLLPQLKSTIQDRLASNGNLPLRCSGPAVSPSSDGLSSQLSSTAEKAKKLDELAAMLYLDPKVDTGNVDDAKLPEIPHRQPVPLAFDRHVSSPPASSAYGSAAPPTMRAANEVEVRLTLPVYNAMCKERDDLKAKLEATLEARLDLTNQKSNTLTGYTHSNTIGPCTDRDHIDLHEKLVENSRVLAGTESELDSLKYQLAATEQKLAAMETKMKEYKDKMSEHDKLLHEQRHAEPYRESLQDLRDTVPQREKAMAKLREEMVAVKTESGFLKHRLDEILSRPDPQKRIAELEEELRKKTADCSRLRNELHDAKRLIEVKQAIIERVSDNGRQLRGAIHLVEPAATTKLPKTVLGCMECYVKNLQCDHRARCQNCVDNNHHCRRMRCALQHVLKTPCPDYPFCVLKHNPNGWLVSDQVRPQW